MAWFYLLAAGVCEIGFTTIMRFAEGFKNLWAATGFLVCLFLSVFFLELAIRSIPLGTAYAIWTGTGVVGTVLIGMIWFGEPATVTRSLLILGLVGCAIGLKFSTGK